MTRSIFAMIIPLYVLLSGQSSCNPEDLDNDGYTAAEGDCDDSSAAIYPGASESCDAVDNDCDGGIDESLAYVDWYQDQDGDAHGDSFAAPILACAAPVGYVQRSGDCNDQDPSIYYDAPERCDGKDNDCNAQVDELNGDERFYVDSDGDGRANPYGQVLIACPSAQASSVVTGLPVDDCNDYDASSYPGAVETCDGYDNDCDGAVDEGLPLRQAFFDVDADGLGGSCGGSSCGLGSGAGLTCAQADGSPAWLPEMDGCVTPESSRVGLTWSQGEGVEVGDCYLSYADM